MSPAQRRLVVVVVVIALVAAGISGVVIAMSSGSGDELSNGEAAPPSPEVTRAPEESLADFYGQSLEWSECAEHSGMQCAELEVPLDYADPAGETIELALLKDPADVPEDRVGSLVVNPGGPGAPGTTYASSGGFAFGRPLRDRVDIVGFDPRGTGDSAPVECLDDEELDEYVAVDPVPDDPGEVTELVESNEAMASGCVENSGAIVKHVSTVEAARDMDILRAALGESKLSYLGVSYGTKLGATYASLFPERTGRFVLDGALDPGATSREMNLTQARGFEVALRAYVADCVEGGDCYLGDTVEEGVGTVREFLEEVDDDPLPAAGDRELTVGNAFFGIITPLYNRSYWKLLDQALQAGLEGDGSTLMMLSDAYSSRGPDGYTDNSIEAQGAISCLDDSSSWTPKQVRRHLPAFEKASPTFGPALAWMMTGCSGHDLEASEEAPTIKAAGADPILVVGTTRDPATPYRWAEELAGQLASGVLISREGDGHGGYHVGNQCVDDAVEGYLLEGTVPRDGLSC